MTNLKTLWENGNCGINDIKHVNLDKLNTSNNPNINHMTDLKYWMCIERSAF